MASPDLTESSQLLLQNGIKQTEGVETDRLVEPERGKNVASRDRKYNIWMIVGFCVSCVAKFVTGSVFVFFLYQNAIKQMFSFTQTQIETLSSMISVGLGFGFLPGMFFDRFGPRMTSLVGLITASGAYTWIWSTAFFVDFYKDNYWLMAIAFFFAGFGPGFTLMVCLNTNVVNFSERHTGKVVGILNAFFAGSPSVFATVYYTYFVKTEPGDSDKQTENFTGFILMIAIMFGVVNILCLIFLKLYKNQSKPEMTVPTEQISSAHVQSDMHIPLKELLLKGDYILLVVAFSLASAVSVVFGVNITLFTKSVGLQKYDPKLTLISPICNAVLSALIGIFSDVFKAKIPRLQILVLGCFGFVLCLLLVIVSPTQIWALMAAAGLCGVGVAFVFSITPALIKESVNMVDFGRNYGLALFMQALVCIPSLILFGAMYDSHVTEPGTNNCTGSECFVGGLTVFLGLSLAAFVISIILAYRHNRSHRQTRYTIIQN